VARRAGARRAIRDPIALDPYLLNARLIKYTYASIVRGIDQRVQALRLTAKQWEPLLLLSLGRADTMVGLAEYVGMDFGGMTRILARLEKKKLLRRYRSATDKRVVHLKLTPSGRAVAKKIFPEVRQVMTRHLAGFSQRDLALLTILLQRMLKNDQG
jgi:DNA-binding MarR family transcriptional regulator